MTLFWGLPMVGPYCFTRGGAMQMRGQDLLLVPPLPRLAFLQMPKLCPTPVWTPPSSDQEPVFGCPALPPPPLQPKGE